MRMLKKAASFVLASLGASTYEKTYASAPRLLRPRWTTFLNILGTLATYAQLPQVGPSSTFASLQ